MLLLSGTAVGCSRSGGSTVSSNGSEERTVDVCLACLKMVSTLERAAVLTRTHQMGKTRGRRGMTAVMGSVRKSWVMVWSESQDQEYMCLQNNSHITLNLRQEDIEIA